jgi:hypothetical protein
VTVVEEKEVQVAAATATARELKGEVGLVLYMPRALPQLVDWCCCPCSSLRSDPSGVVTAAMVCTAHVCFHLGSRGTCCAGLWAAAGAVGDLPGVGGQHPGAVRDPGGAQGQARQVGRPRRGGAGKEPFSVLNLDGQGGGAHVRLCSVMQLRDRRLVAFLEDRLEVLSDAGSPHRQHDHSAPHTHSGGEKRRYGLLVLRESLEADWMTDGGTLCRGQQRQARASRVPPSSSPRRAAAWEEGPGTGGGGESHLHAWLHTGISRPHGFGALQLSSDEDDDDDNSDVCVSCITDPVRDVSGPVLSP